MPNAPEWSLGVDQVVALPYPWPRPVRELIPHAIELGAVMLAGGATSPPHESARDEKLTIELRSTSVIL